MQLYQTDRAWADSHHGQVVSILKTLLPHLAVIDIANDVQDQSFATDFVVKLSGGDIACRLRRPGCIYRDWTLRSSRISGATTELAKIKAGFAFRYFYGWLSDAGKIAEWMLIDLDQVRALNLLDVKYRPEIDNHDGTWFVPIPIYELRAYDCLLAACPDDLGVD
jgi:hypothetical protein